MRFLFWSGLESKFGPRRDSAASQPHASSINYNIEFAGDTKHDDGDESVSSDDGVVRVASDFQI